MVNCWGTLRSICLVDKYSSRRTPYNDNYPSCERADSELLIYTGTIDPKWVADQLAIEGAQILVKGEKSLNIIGRIRETKSNRWRLTSASAVESLDIRRHIDWLLEEVEPKRKILRMLQETEGIRMSVYCVWWSAAGHGGPTLWPEQMERLAKLNLELSFDIYFFGDEED